MVPGRDTFAGDVLAGWGVRNIYAGHLDWYPRIGIEQLRSAGAGLVVVPDEPYQFTADDGPEAFPVVPAALVSDRHLTWYGPSLAEAPAVLSRRLRDVIAPAGWAGCAGCAGWAGWHRPRQREGDSYGPRQRECSKYGAAAKTAATARRPGTSRTRHLACPAPRVPGTSRACPSARLAGCERHGRK
jgi:hypothetical protein